MFQISAYRTQVFSAPSNYKLLLSACKGEIGSRCTSLFLKFAFCSYVSTHAHTVYCSHNDAVLAMHFFRMHRCQKVTHELTLKVEKWN